MTYDELTDLVIQLEARISRLEAYQPKEQISDEDLEAIRQRHESYRLVPGIRTFGPKANK